MEEMTKTKQPPLDTCYQALFQAWGPQHWWPGQTRMEIITGAILTQNTAWSNVEKAIRNLRQQKALRIDVLSATPEKVLADWIRPAGYFNVKARRLKAFVHMMTTRFDGSLNRLFRLDTATLRKTLLEVNGIGPETADSIMLYAGNKPVFVIDAYTRRMLERHGWANHRASYDDLAILFTHAIPADITVYNEYHALIVRLGKMNCRTRPHCEGCPLQPLLPKGGPRLTRTREK
jgi:endonuclease-3 related protein